MTRDELVTEVRSLIGQTDSTNTQFSNTVIETQIYEGLRDFSRRTHVLEDTEDISTTANQLEYTWTSKFLKLSQVRYIYTSGDVGQILKPYPGGDNALPETVQYGKPYWYVLRGAHDTSEQKLIAWPVPDVSSKTIRITGYLEHGNLLTGSNEPDMMKAYHIGIAYFAAWKVSMRYSHKSTLARQKAFDLRNMYLDVVNDAINNTQTPHEDGPIETVDVYA